MMAIAMILEHKQPIKAYALHNDEDLNAAAEAITNFRSSVLFFRVPRAAVMEACPELEENA